MICPFQKAGFSTDLDMKKQHKCKISCLKTTCRFEDMETETRSLKNACKASELSINRPQGTKSTLGLESEAKLASINHLHYQQRHRRSHNINKNKNRKKQRVNLKRKKITWLFKCSEHVFFFLKTVETLSILVENEPMKSIIFHIQTKILLISYIFLA